MGNITMPSGSPSTQPNGNGTSTTAYTGPPRIHYTCHDYYLEGRDEGVYTIQINGTDVDVYCKMYRNVSDVDVVREGGWTVILR